MVGILSGEVLAGAAAAAMALDFGMPLQIVGKTVGNDRSLLNHVHTFGLETVDFIDE